MVFVDAIYVLIGLILFFDQFLDLLKQQALEGAVYIRDREALSDLQCGYCIFLLEVAFREWMDLISD